MNRRIESIKGLLEDSTLVVIKGGAVSRFSRRGVADLLWILDNDADLLRGASVAVKIIGKAAASLMIMGGVSNVYTPKITVAALQMLQAAEIGVEYDSTIEFVENRTHTGRCPLDTLCADMSEPSEMAAAIRDFLNQQK